MSQAVADLLAEGWVMEGSSKRVGNGRPSVPLTLDDSRLAVVGAELGVDYINVVSLDLVGKILSKRRILMRHGSVSETIDTLAEQISLSLDNLVPSKRRVVGIGIAVPGLVDSGSEILTNAPNLGWTTVPVRRLLIDNLPADLISQIPVFVDNEGNASVMGEYMFRGSPGHQSIVYLSLGIGVGGGIVLAGQLYTGHEGFAAEFGHTTIFPDGLRCTCGNSGCAEMYVSQKALTSAISEKNLDAKLTMENIVALANSNDPMVHAAMHSAARSLGILIANIINTLNPNTVIVGGPVMELGHLLLNPALAEIRYRTLKESLHNVTVSDQPVWRRFRSCWCSGSRSLPRVDVNLTIVKV